MRVLGWGLMDKSFVCVKFDGEFNDSSSFCMRLRNGARFGKSGFQYESRFFVAGTTQELLSNEIFPIFAALRP